MTKKLGLDEARVVVEAVLGAASGRNLRFAAAVVDSGGELVYFARMDGASPLNARMAVNKGRGLRGRYAARGGLYRR